jgi:hypothetical protein
MERNWISRPKPSPSLLHVVDVTPSSRNAALAKIRVRAPVFSALPNLAVHMVLLLSLKNDEFYGIGCERIR